jgi:predicted nucleotidyltransferase
LINLSSEHQIIVSALLKQYLPGVPVWAFGSRVLSTANEGSDLDLVVHLSEQDSLATVREAFRESNLPFSVEFLDWNLIPEHFRQEILKKYEVLQ